MISFEDINYFGDDPQNEEPSDTPETWSVSLGDDEWAVEPKAFEEGDEWE